MRRYERDLKSKMKKLEKYKQSREGVEKTRTRDKQKMNGTSDTSR